MPAHFDAFLAQVQLGRLGQRMCLWHAPAGSRPQALVVHVHAFGDEMNKSRRMASLFCRALADSGAAAVLQMDLLGCGDSDGEFEDATWEAWVADVMAAAVLARARAAQAWPEAPALQPWLWGHRAGCLLAAEAAAKMPDEAWNLLFWQPVVHGKAVLQQLLRVEAAASMLGKQPDAPASAKEQLAAGQVAQLAGYCLQPALASALQAATLRAPPRAQRLEWLDVAPQTEGLPALAARTTMEQWREAGWSVRHHAVAGPAFWQTAEIEDAPGLIAAGLPAMAASTPDLASPLTEAINS